MIKFFFCGFDGPFTFVKELPEDKRSYVFCARMYSYNKDKERIEFCGSDIYAYVDGEEEKYWKLLTDEEFEDTHNDEFAKCQKIVIE